MEKELFKEFYECESRNEQIEIWQELARKGYDTNRINMFNYQGRDGKFHRIVSVCA